MERKITDGLWIGDMAQVPYRPTFDAVLTVSEEPGKVDDKIRHRHLYFTDSTDPQTDTLIKACDWVQDLWEDGKEILIRSANGVNRPQYVLVATFIQMGADNDEALDSVVRRVETPLQNDVFLEALQQW